jgi:hypothetical protein
MREVRAPGPAMWFWAFWRLVFGFFSACFCGMGGSFQRLLFCFFGGGEPRSGCWLMMIEVRRSSYEGGKADTDRGARGRLEVKGWVYWH